MRDRTADLLDANQALSQLSYSPDTSFYFQNLLKMVGLGRLELPTSPLSGVRSNQLSYRPIIICEQKNGLAIAGLTNNKQAMSVDTYEDSIV
jgi:hypothetical protein